jgi:hypothetical protein
LRRTRLGPHLASRTSLSWFGRLSATCAIKTRLSAGVITRMA